MEQTSAKTETVEYPPNPYFSIFILTLATFMQVLDTTIVNVSLPKMAGDFGISPYEANWIIGSYLIATAAVLPISGWLATYFGRKNYYLACCFLFTISSVLCGLAVDYQTIIIARVLQGGRISLTVGLISTIVSLIVGVSYGAIAGYLGGD